MWLFDTWFPSLVSGNSVPHEWRDDLRRSRLYSWSQLPLAVFGAWILGSSFTHHQPIPSPFWIGVSVLLSSFFSYKADVEHVCHTSPYHAIDLGMALIVMGIAARVLSILPHPLLLLGVFFSLLFRCLAWEGLRRGSKDLFLISHSLWHVCLPLAGILFLSVHSL